MPSRVIANTSTDSPPGVPGRAHRHQSIRRRRPALSGCFASHAHQPAARPAASAKATGAGSTLIAQRIPPASTPTMNSADFRDNPDATRATYPLIRVPTTVWRSMSSA